MHHDITESQKLLYTKQTQMSERYLPVLLWCQSNLIALSTAIGNINLQPLPNTCRSWFPLPNHSFTVLIIPFRLFFWFYKSFFSTICKYFTHAAGETFLWIIFTLYPESDKKKKTYHNTLKLKKKRKKTRCVCVCVLMIDCPSSSEVILLPSSFIPDNTI